MLVKHAARAQGRRRGSLLLPDLRSQGDRGRASKEQAQRIPGENAPPLTLGNTAGASVTTGPVGAGEGRAHPRACHPNGVEARGPRLSVAYRLAQGSPEPALKPQVRGTQPVPTFRPSFQALDRGVLPSGNTPLPFHSWLCC